MKRNLLKTLLVAVGLLASTSGAFAALEEVWSIDFVAKGGNYTADQTAVIDAANPTTIAGVDLGTVTVGDDAIDSKFLLQTGTTWLLRTLNNQKGLYQMNGGARSFGLANCVAGQTITIGTVDGNNGSDWTPVASANATLQSSNEDKTVTVFTVTEDGNVLFSLPRYVYIQTIKVEEVAGGDELEIAKASYASALATYSTAKEAAVVDYTYVDDAKLFWHPTSAKTAFESTLATIEGDYQNALVADGETDAAAYDAATATINGLSAEFATAVSAYNATLNMPEEGKAYALKQVYSGKYFTFSTAVAEVVDTQIGVTFSAAADGRVYIVSADNLLLQVSHSGSNNWDIFGAATAGGSFSSEWLFIPQSDTEYRIQTPTQSRFIGGDTETMYGNKKDTEAGILWTIEEVNSANVAVTSAGFATYCPSIALDFSGVESIEAYIASVDGSTVTLTKVETVAAGEGVLLRSVNGGAAEENIPAAAGAIKAEDNAFVGTLTNTVVYESDDANTNYVLSQEDGVVGLFKAAVEGTNVAAGKAYLPVAGASEAKGLTMVFGGEATGISEVGAQKAAADNAYYTLSGVRVQQPTKGLYIVNGKKVVIK